MGTRLQAAPPETPAPTEWPWAGYGLPETTNPCAIPTSYPKDDWHWNQFAGWKKTDYKTSGKNVIFLGDSITHGWNWMPDYPDGNGAKVWKEYADRYPSIRPLSLGMSGDQPQNTLWLLTKGELLEPFPSPKVIVLMIGINSLNKKRTPEEVAGGIRTILEYLRQTKPESKLLLLGILPCWGPTAPVRTAIPETNDLIRNIADGKSIYFLNFGEKLLTPEGKMNPDLSYDAIHLTTRGYEVWAKAMFPYLEDLMETGGSGSFWNKKGKAIPLNADTPMSAQQMTN